MEANGAEGLTQINFKTMYYEVSLWYMNAFKIFWSPEFVFPKKMTNFCLDLAFSHENLRLSQKVFWGNSWCYIFENTSKGVSHSCPCRLFREHWVINLPRAKSKGSTASLKSCRSESVKKNLVRRFFSDLWAIFLRETQFLCYST